MRSIATRDMLPHAISTTITGSCFCFHAHFTFGLSYSIIVFIGSICPLNCHPPLVETIPFNFSSSTLPYQSHHVQCASFIFYLIFCFKVFSSSVRCVQVEVWVAIYGSRSLLNGVAECRVCDVWASGSLVLECKSKRVIASERT